VTLFALALAAGGQAERLKTVQYGRFTRGCVRAIRRIIQPAVIDNENTALELTKRLVQVQSDLVHLQAFVSVLKACVAVLLMPDDTEEALKYLSHLEDLILKANPTEPARMRVLDVIEALQTLRKRGSSGLDS
jgi:hypothetical protein